jgi:hypothetical protein
MEPVTVFAQKARLKTLTVFAKMVTGDGDDEGGCTVAAK